MIYLNFIRLERVFHLYEKVKVWSNHNVHLYHFLTIHHTVTNILAVYVNSKDPDQTMNAQLESWSIKKVT